ncbi:VIR protein [Plasmodium vivax]|uniref:VIR protein n=1 Tax=Plasmodium vivax TaxID=5855 RepID=A0A1G4E3E7_PLAVI|nr:VIR protein [Plasmodium vivax]
MSKCQSGSGTYLNYECYEFLKPKFDKISLSEHNKGYLSKAVATLEKNHYILASYEENFQEITSRITDAGVFYSANPRIACSYINYLLNKKLRSNRMHTYNVIYNLFKKFVEEFHKNERGNYNYGQVCAMDIKSLDDNIYDRMTNLYELYDMYLKLKSTGLYFVKDRCDTFGLMIKKYNEAIEEYQLKDVELLNKILSINDLTKKLTLPPDDKCPYRIIYFNKPLLYLKKQEEEKAKKLQEERELQQREQQRREEQQREQPSNGELLGTPSVLRTPDNDAISSELRAGEERLSANPILPRGQQQLKGNKFIDSETTLLDPLGGQKEELEQLDVKSHELENYHVSQTDTSGVFGSLQNTISSFIREVEPAPILGVSGGMGALFLLFKYTPVGSFFGGRRGRIRQIPSSFRGFPPGEFPNFHEYDGGFIGYGPMNINPFAE